MIYNSEIIINNDTPERGNVTGKRMRLTGTSGRLFAKVSKKTYKFDRWEDGVGNTISTSNPIIITDWGPRVLTVIFSHVMLDDQMFADHDAIGTQTDMLEMLGVAYRSNPTDAYASYTYYSQKNRSGPATRTTPYGQVYQTNEKPYGYSTGVTTDDYSAYWDPTGVNPSTGTFHRHPDSYDFAPVSGFAAEMFDPGLTHAESRTSSSKRSYYDVGGANNYYQFVNNSHTHYTGRYYGITNTPAVGTPTQYPMWKWMPYRLLQTSGSPQYVDLTGLEHSHIQRIENLHNYVPNAFNHVVNMDAAKYMSLLYVNFSHNAGAVNVRVQNTAYHPSTHGAATTLHDTSPTKTSPRLIEPLGYTPLRFFSLRSQYYWRDTYDYSGPMDSQKSETHPGMVPNPHWVEQSKHAPNSGSLLWSLRYTPLEDLRISYTTLISDYSAFKHYYRNLKNLSIQAPNWDGYGSRTFASQSMPDLKGLKNLRSFQWYENYNHNSFNVDTPFDWSGLKDLKNLKTLYINHSYDTYLKNLNLSDIPDSCKHVSLNPLPPLSEAEWPEETTLGALSFESGTVTDRSLLSGDMTIYNSNALTIISTT